MSHCWGSTIRYVAIILYLLGTLTACTTGTIKKQILFIQSYEAGFPVYDKTKKMLAANLNQRQIAADIYMFYLDALQNPVKNQRLNIYNELEKFSSRNLDLILVNDDEALEALLTSKHPALDSLPIVFMGVNYPNISQIQKYPNITGFHDKPDYKTNIRLIEQLIGKCIVVRIMDNTLVDKLIVEDMDEQIKDICPTNDIFSPDRVRLSGKPGTFLANIPKIHPKSTYISTIDAQCARSIMEGTGENYYNKAYLATQRNNATATLGRTCAFPGFSTINEMVGYDNRIVGGYITSVHEQVQLAANRVADILNGMPVTGFPQITETNKSYIFNYKALEEWHIPSNNLPVGAVYLNMPFYIRYQNGLITLIILALLLITATIIYQRKQYKREATYKKEAQNRLKQEKEFLSFALESGNIFAFRYKNGIFEFDKEFYHTLGIPEQPMTAEQFQEAIHPDEQADFIKNRYKLDHGFPSRQITRRRYDFNKKGYSWWEFRYAQTLNDDTSEKQDIKVSGLCLNIQQIKENEACLIEARKKAEESDHMKSLFLANMSHEIRTPLNAIVGFSQLLGSDMAFDPEEKSEFTDLISKNSDLLLKLINDILDLSRIESGRISFTFENHNLSKLIEDVYNTHHLLMPENVELRKKMPETPAIIHTDWFRLTQVLTNFINNATKFTNSGYIEVSYDYSPDNKYILIMIADTGIGIPKEKQAQVFERFQKLNEFAQGTGLGLAISKSIIQTFNGSIQVESEEGKGSTFTIALPYTPNLIEKEEIKI
ncbi:HAMP domain-containing sensor histidine kinase [Parabacteroides sp. AM08-6]|uniref:sensor histidine kinase n=1 Tax=Parabacteroides sp. AM08-6 TaxID=2292053 RepID=UPI000EFFD305|nr:HAMP domain-containing sensor histidine kinase [Parabacteroides sp. AM08-6]RHJ87618.1 sensor histidine kinase [Parabacteroides sp. AM08-6]